MALAPVVVTTHRFDPLRDEGLEYANFLIDGNVTVLQEELRGSHSYALIADSQGARRAAKLFERIVVEQDYLASKQQQQQQEEEKEHQPEEDNGAHSNDGVQIARCDGVSSAASSTASSDNLSPAATPTLNGSGPYEQADDNSSSSSSSSSSNGAFSRSSHKEDNQL